VSFVNECGLNLNAALSDDAMLEDLVKDKIFRTGRIQGVKWKQVQQVLAETHDSFFNRSFVTHTFFSNFGNLIIISYINIFTLITFCS